MSRHIIPHIFLLTLITGCGDCTENMVDYTTICGESNEEYIVLPTKEQSQESDPIDIHCITKRDNPNTLDSCPGTNTYRSTYDATYEGIVICSKAQLDDEELEYIKQELGRYWLGPLLRIEGSVEVAQGAELLKEIQEDTPVLLPFWTIIDTSDQQMGAGVKGSYRTRGTEQAVLQGNRFDMENDKFKIEFHEPPSPYKLNSNGIGVAVLGGLYRNTFYSAQIFDNFNEGYDTSESGENKAFTDQYAIIYKSAWTKNEALTEEGSHFSWATKFPEGYSCAKGVPATTESTLDTFEPVSCDDVVVKVSQEFNFVNWFPYEGEDYQ